MKILVNGSYKNSFEAFTLIENSVDSLCEDKLDQYISMIRKGIVEANHDKQLLLLEMVSVLDKAKRAMR